LVCPDEKLFVLQVMTPQLNCHQNSDALLFVRGQTTVFDAQRLAHVRDGMAFLLQDGANSRVTSISVDHKRFVEIWKA
jgi:hypothetical protein